MIAPDGFVVLSDYAGEIDSELCQLFEEGRDEPTFPKHRPRQEFLEWALQSALMDVDDLWLYSTTGVLHRASFQVGSIMFGRDEMSRSRTTFSLFNVTDMKIDIGKIPNAALPFDDPSKTGGILKDKILVRLHWHDLELVRNFSAFDGYYLTVREGALPAAKDIDTVVLARGGESELRQGQTVDHIEAMLRQLAEQGQLPKRDQFRREHAPDMKIDAFKAIWRSVASEFPELSRPGPKPNPKSKS